MHVCTCIRLTHACAHPQAAVQSAETLELATVGEEEVRKRTAELRRMRDLLFHHEIKLKRASKIK